MPSISPFLWFNGQAEEAAKFYVSIFPNSKLGKITRYGKNMPMPKGTVLTVSFTINGQDFTALNGGPEFQFTEAVSFAVGCQTQSELDHYWERLTADGGQPSQCGWLKDKYGLSWQIVPESIGRLIDASDSVRSQRVFGALMTMNKIDVAALEAAYAGK